MNTTEQWIKDNRFENTFFTSSMLRDGLKYKNLTILYKKHNGGYITTCDIDHLSEYTIQNRFNTYKTIEEVLFVIDESDVFKHDLKWKMVITLLKERAAQ